jgi:diguanylate cyclase (GGDEF)-like protein/PAS domain S-box-containing protein
MKEDKPDSNSPGYLRRRAEKRLAMKKIKDVQKMTEQDFRTLAYELQVHHIELEMQNEELKRAYAEAEDALGKYTDLYDFAPVGYFTFDRHGTILEVNLAGAALLDIERRNLIDKRFQLFVKPDGIPVFNAFCNKALEMNTKQTCEIELVKHDASSIYVRLEGIAIENRKGKEKQCRTAITDITAHKQEEEKIHLLQTISMAISTAENLQSMLDIILRRVCEVAGWVYGEVWIPSSDGKQLEYSWAWYSNLEPLEEFMMRSKEFTFPPGIGLPGRVWATKQPVWIKDVTLDPNYLRATIARDVGLKAAVAFPLFAGEEVVAVIVSYMFAPIEKEEHLVNLISSMSSHLGWVIKRKQVEEAIQQMAYNDTLTSLPNRLQFEDRLTLELAHARRNKTILAVIFLDLDGFKVINDTLGHSVGDQVLQGIAGRLRSCMREADTVSRFGGDEFTVVLPMVSHAEDAAMIAKKIIEVVRQPLTIGSNEFAITTSIGIALFPDDGEDVETLMKNADSAMYHAKKAGKNNYQFFVSRNSIA